MSYEIYSQVLAFRAARFSGGRSLQSYADILRVRSGWNIVGHLQSAPARVGDAFFAASAATFAALRRRCLAHGEVDSCIDGALRS